MTDQPLLTFQSDSQRPWFGSVAVSDLDPDLVFSIRSDLELDHLLRSIFRVTVIESGWPESDDLPNVFGRYQILENGVRFIPRFPFERGVRYRATFDPQPLARFRLSEVSTLEFSLPKESSALPTEVTQVFPSGACLPENLLRFYVRFSASMQRGRCEQQIALIGSDGRPIPDALYRSPVELWDRSMRHLTVLLDPGRLKRGVEPNRELGLPLKAGQEYTLAIGSGMTDFSGRPLRESFYKTFRVTEPVRRPVAVEEWKILPPAANSREPLAIMFPNALDWALLWHTITVASEAGQPIDGRIAIDQDERRWSFTPTSAWTAGSYRVRVASSLEDVCGNNLLGPFDGPLRSAHNLNLKVSNRSIAFHLA
jgi:hypothetical protein